MRLLLFAPCGLFVGNEQHASQQANQQTTEMLQSYREEVQGTFNQLARKVDVYCRAAAANSLIQQALRLINLLSVM
jgi:hypothetical protein